MNEQDLPARLRDYYEGQVAAAGPREDAIAESLRFILISADRLDELAAENKRLRKELREAEPSRDPFSGTILG